MKKIIFLCFVSVILPVLQCRELLDELTDEEIQYIFQTSRENVPQFQMLTMHQPKRVRRSVLHKLESSLKVNAFDHEYNLYLKPTEGLLAGKHMPIWKAFSDRSSTNGIMYHIVPNDVEKFGVPLQDETNLAALVVNALDDGKLYFDGVIGEDLIVRALPKRITHYKGIVPREHSNVYVNFSSAHPGYTYEINQGLDENGVFVSHVIFRKNMIKGSFQGLNLDYSYTSKRTVGDSDPAPNVIYPEILVFIDFLEFQALGADIYKAAEYIIAFMNAVDLRFRVLHGPKVRLSISGIVMAAERKAMPYLTKNQLPNTRLLDADGLLIDAGKYLYRESRFPSSAHDIALFLTRLDLCNYDGAEKTAATCKSDTLGYAYTKGGCRRSERKQQVQSVALVEDDSAFSGIIPVAHEIGHLFGANHDGEKTSAECNSFGYILQSQFDLDENIYNWTNCSLHSFQSYLNSEKAKCFRNKPQADEQITRYLPGQVFSTKEQCRRRFGPGSEPCEPQGASLCIRLFCRLPTSDGSESCEARFPAAEGSECAKDMICLNGQCVGIHGIEKLLPSKQPATTSPMHYRPASAEPSQSQSYYHYWSAGRQQQQQQQQQSYYPLKYIRPQYQARQWG